MAAPKWEYERPPLFQHQLDAVFHDRRWGVVEACTKSGKTTACLIWLFEQALSGPPGANFWWVAPVASQAEIAFARLKRAVTAKIYDASESDLAISLHNGTTIQFRSGDRPDSLYGEDVYAAVLDEASRMKEDAWHAVRSTLTATRGPARIVGNVHGRQNWMFQLARAAEAGETDMHFARISADEAVAAGMLEREEIENARRMLPEHRFLELYYAIATDDEHNPFGLTAIRDAIAPMSSGPPIVFGWDVAKYQDWTVGIALDASGTVCQFRRFQDPWEPTIATISKASGEIPLWIDGTGVGDPIVERLQRAGHRRVTGMRFTQQLKQQLIEDLAIAIQSGEVRFPTGPIAAELEAFQSEWGPAGVKYGAPAGVHDDCVIALALAWYGYKRIRRRRTGGFIASIGPGRSRVYRLR